MATNGERWREVCRRIVSPARYAWRSHVGDPPRWSRAAPLKPLAAVCGGVEGRSDCSCCLLHRPARQQPGARGSLRAADVLPQRSSAYVDLTRQGASRALVTSTVTRGRLDMLASGGPQILALLSFSLAWLRPNCQKCQS